MESKLTLTTLREIPSVSPGADHTRVNGFPVLVALATARLARRLSGPVAAGLLAVIAGLSFLAIPSPSYHLSDFGAFVSAGRSLAAGINPYTSYLLVDNVPSSAPNLNPPISLVAFSLLATADPIAAMAIWRWLALAVYIAVVAILLNQRREWLTPIRLAWLVAFAALPTTIALGQIYTVLVAFVAGAVLLRRSGRPILAGVFLGAFIAVKPPFALWSLFLLLSGETAFAASAIATAAAISLVPIALYGTSVYADWFAALGGTLGGLEHEKNVSLAGVFARAGAVRIGEVAAVALCLGLAWFVYTRRPTADTIAALGIIGGILASPLGWSAYALFLVPWLVGKRIRLATGVAMAILAAPSPLVSLVLGWSPTLISMPYTVALVVLLVVAVKEVPARNRIRRLTIDANQLLPAELVGPVGR